MIALVKEIRSRDAAAPELCQQVKPRSQSPENEGRRSAERRIHPWPHRRMRQRAERSALALRRSTTALASAIERLGSAQAALHASGACRHCPQPQADRA
jgi:hypothetical protein